MRLRGDETVKKAELADVLRAGLEEKPDEVALVSAESSWSWRELEAASRRYAVGLFAHGVRPGDRVATLMPNRAELLIHYFGCLRAGFVATPLNYRYMPPEIDHALSLTKAVLLISHAERTDIGRKTCLVTGLTLLVMGASAAQADLVLVGGCRLLDTRQPREGPALVGQTTREVMVRGVCGMSEEATGIQYNATIVNPAAQRLRRGGSVPKTRPGSRLHAGGYPATWAKG